jgi:23S rRNA pseudouridine1911/1915/1917 synthase
MLRFLVGDTEAGRRLDLALSALVGVPRSQARRWIDQGFVTVDGAPARAAQRVREGEALEAEPPEPIPLSLEPEPIPLSVLWEDPDLIAVDKPAGLVVHPAPGHPRGTLVNALLHHCRDLAGIGGVLRPGIVHRLDRGTSGVLVAAKNDAAHLHLAEQFRAHTIERVYLALVRGVPSAEAGGSERGIGRHPRDRKRMAVQARGGRAAATRWTVLRRFERSGASLLEVRPESGRTHQIRVHLASIGHPVVGDAVYGPHAPQRSDRTAREAAALARATPRQALHAAFLALAHPATGERLELRSEWPADLRPALAVALGDPKLLAVPKPLEYLGLFAFGPWDDRP